ncbi:hypothetical protein [Thioclava sp.]|uniref:hypothetical protein n=1 Tax=Thioclava sp. TaxID=1933450 RepID=UPI003AA9BEA4
MSECNPPTEPEAAQPGQTRLRDCPAWTYLLQEFYGIYARGSAGGSKAIRSHRKRVVQGI